MAPLRRDPQQIDNLDIVVLEKTREIRGRQQRVLVFLPAHDDPLRGAGKQGACRVDIDLDPAFDETPVHDGRNPDPAQALRDRVVAVVEPRVAHQQREHGFLFEYFPGGHVRADDRDHCRQDQVRVRREFEQGQQTGKRGLQRRAHHRPHAKHHEQAVRGTQARNSFGAVGEHATDHGADYDGRPDQATRDPDRDTGRTRDEFREQDQHECAECNVAENGRVHGVIAHPEHGGNLDRDHTDKNARQHNRRADRYA